MKKRSLLLLAILLISHWLISQNTISIQKLNMADPIELKMPVMMDSINLKGKKFELKDLLATSIQLPKYEFYNNMVDAMDDIFTLESPNVDYQVQFFSFQLTADRYTKGTIKITSPTLLELYVDDKKEGTKTTEEADFKSSKSLSKEISLLPNQSKTVVIKHISSSKTKKEQQLKIEVTAGKDFKGTNLSSSNDGKRRTKVQDGLEGVREKYNKTSPNGDFVLIGYRGVDNEGKVRSFTELKNIKTGNIVSLGTQIVNWMPQSNKYYYMNKRANDMQLIAVDPATRVEEILSDNIPMGSFIFAPDETFLIYFDTDKEDERKGDLKFLLSPEDRQSY